MDDKADDVLNDGPAYPPASEPAPPATADEPAVPRRVRTRPSLRERVQRLEEQVTQLQDTRQVEERVTERVTDRLRLTSQAVRGSADVIIDAGRRFLPAAVDYVRTDGADPSSRPPAARNGLWGAWFLFDAYADARAMFRMFVDPRYRLPWTARVVPVVLLGLLLTSRIWLPGGSILPDFLFTILDKVVDVALAFLAFKLLLREARRYRESSPDLPPSLRL